jgi:hypothetical protein
MSDYNETVKKILAEKFISGMKMGALTKAEASRMLGFAHENYGTMVTNVTQRDKVSNEVWRRIQEWSNSGESIRDYSMKHNLYVEHKKPKPPGRKPKKHFPDPAKLTQDQERETGAVIPGKKMVLKSGEQEIGRAEVQGKEGISHLENLEKFVKGKPSEPRIQDVPLDRLKVIFDAINDLKAMGYRVHINIYEKG